MIQAVIFDIDGLLVDSEKYWNQARVQMAAELGKQWTDADRRACMGVSTQEWASYMVRRLELDLTLEQVQTKIVGTLLALYTQGIPYLPGAIDAVDLAARHYRVGIASGSHRRLIDAVTNDVHLRGKVSVVVTTDDLAKGKPAPDVYLVAARQLGVSPGECICLEDSANGILAGKAAGMKVIAVPDAEFPPTADVLQMADRVLTTLYAFSLDVIHALDKS